MKKILWIICLMLSFQSVQAKEENNYILKLYKSYSSYKTYFPEKEIDNVSKWSGEKKKCLTYQRKAIGSRSVYETVNECSCEYSPPK